MRAGSLEHRSSKGGVRAGVCYDLGLHSLYPAAAVCSKADVHPHRMALGVDHEAFLPREAHLHRTLEDVGCQRCMMLHGHVLLAAESSSYERCADSDLLLGYGEHAGDFPLVIIDGLVRCIDEDAIAIRHGYRALRFHEGMFCKWGLVLSLEDHIALRQFLDFYE